MRCFYCGCTAFTPGRFLHRISKKGEAGVFACNLCIKKEDISQCTVSVIAFWVRFNKFKIAFCIFIYDIVPKMNRSGVFWMPS